MLDKKIITALGKIVGREFVKTSAEETLCYSYDGTGRQYPPAAVVFPANVEEISAIMTLANRSHLPVVPRGAGSGMTGGALPIKGGLVMALGRCNKIISIDPENQIAVVEPGVITGELQAAVKKQGLFYPPDPASLKFCSIGGNVAECAGGPSAVKYGVTRDYILGLEAVLADGRIIHTGVRTAKGVVGYDLTRLLVGSEGTLAIISKITLKLLAAPTEKATFLAICKSMGQATGLVTRIMTEHLPCTLEYIDQTALGIVKDDMPFPLPAETAALLLIEVDGDPASVETQAARLDGFLATAPQLIEYKKAADSGEVAALWAARRGISPAAFKLKPDKISEDVVVPRNKIPQLVEFMEETASKLGLVIFTFGHAGDGNIHVNIMLNRENAQELTAAMTAKQRLFEFVIKLGGTLSGEHGVGITKAAYLGMEIDTVTLDLMLALKKMFDPNDILNPGKIFPPPPAS